MGVSKTPYHKNEWEPWVAFSCNCCHQVTDTNKFFERNISWTNWRIVFLFGLLLFSDKVNLAWIFIFFLWIFMVVNYNCCGFEWLKCTQLVTRFNLDHVFVISFWLDARKLSLENTNKLLTKTATKIDQLPFWNS